MAICPAPRRCWSIQRPHHRRASASGKRRGRLREALRLVPGVQVQDSNGTGGSDISLNLSVRG
jgi:outer membrane receptor for Fe3+-dicitrate